MVLRLSGWSTCFCFFFGMLLREQGVLRTSGAKTKQGEFFVGGNPLIAY